MPERSSLLRCRRLPENRAGRDFVVGDLHGHRALLERALETLHFDPACDRVLSVGDLIDRGPDSLATLALIEEPWFHAVLGNHELMLLNYLGFYASRVHARKSFASGGGQWIAEAEGRHRKKLRRLAERVAELPLALHVEGTLPFNVTHGDLHPLGGTQQSLFAEERVCVHVADSASASRANIADALQGALVALPFDRRSVQVSETPLGALPLTYVGHSPLTHVTVHNSYVYIDQRVSARSSRQAEDRPPTVLEHAQFAHWLRGVALARARAGSRPVAQETA